MRFPAGNPDQLRSAIENIRKGKTEQRSPVGTLANELANEAARGLRELMGRIGSGSDITTLDAAFNRLPPERRNKVQNHYDALVYAISVMSIEDSLIDREFNIRNFVTMYNNAISGTPLPKLVVEGEGIERFPEDRLAAMYHTIKDGKTFASFFRGPGLKSLPNFLRQVLTSSGLLARIDLFALPFWEVRAQYLIPRET